MNEGSLRLAVVGLGYWGPNLARNFAAISGCELAWLYDPSPDAREQAATRFPTARVTGDLAEVLADDTLDAVALATPVPTHADLAVRVLEAGKHCFVEKPLAQSVADAERAAAAADEHGRVLMVGHLLEYHPGVQQLKQLTESGELGADLLHLQQPPEPGEAASRRERAVEPRRPRRLSRALPRQRGAVGDGGAWRVVRAGRGRGRRVLLPSVPVRARRPTCTCRGSIRTRSAGSRSSARAGWRRSTTWRSRGS